MSFVGPEVWSFPINQAAYNSSVDDLSSGQVWVKSEEECRELCHNMSSCKSIDYHTTRQQCTVNQGAVYWVPMTLQEGDVYQHIAYATHGKCKHM